MGEKIEVKKAELVDGNKIVVSEDMILSSGQAIRLEVSQALNGRVILSTPNSLIDNGVILMNSGQVKNPEDKLELTILNTAPAVVSLQSKERGNFPDLSIWNDSGTLVLRAGDVICDLTKI